METVGSTLDLPGSEFSASELFRERGLGLLRTTSSLEEQRPKLTVEEVQQLREQVKMLQSRSDSNDEAGKLQHDSDAITDSFLSYPWNVMCWLHFLSLLKQLHTFLFIKVSSFKFWHQPLYATFCFILFIDNTNQLRRRINNLEREKLDLTSNLNEQVWIRKTTCFSSQNIATLLFCQMTIDDWLISVP